MSSAAVLAVLACGLCAAPASADFTASHSAGVGGGVGTVTFTGDSGSDVFTIRSATSPNLGFLLHNRFGQGDPGFASQFDFDSTLAGEQRLTDSTASSVIVNAGDGFDNGLFFGPTPGAGTVQAKLTFNGQGDTDTIDFFTSDANQSVTLNSNKIDGVFGSQIDYSLVEAATVRTGGGDDTIQVDNALTAPTVLIANAGNDTLEPAEGASLGNNFRAGPGTDTLDYSNWTDPVTTNLGAEANFTATLDGAQEVPPTGSAATGTGTVRFADTTTNLFDYSLNVSGLTAAQITDSHIHSGAPGVDGPIIFPIGPGSGWTNPGGPSTAANGQTDPDITEPALRDGNTYFNVHTSAFTGGEIRGQITLDPDIGYGGPATATSSPGAFMVENVIGGSGADDLRGNPLANKLQGRGGADTLHAGPGDDELVGGGAADALFGEEGADTLKANDGQADTTIDCGPGTDSALRDIVLDPAPVDCETLSGPAAPTLTATDPASPANDNTPKVKGTAPAGPPAVTIDLYKNNGCSGAPAVNDAPAADLTGAGIQVNVPDNSTTAFSATATQSGGTSGCSNSIAYTENTPAPPAPPPPTPPTPPPGGGGPTDTTAPTSTLDKHPKKKTKKRKAKFRFSADEPGSTFQCALDKKDFKPCTSPTKFKKLKVRKHKFKLLATDPAGNVSEPVVFRWRVVRR
jgi:hypothetical protein